MAKFYFNGCSHTYGDELVDPKKSRWSRVVCDHFDAEEINVSEGGSSNDRIFRMLFEDTAQYDYDHVFIMWTHPERFEIFNENNIEVMNPEDPRPYIPIKLNRILFSKPQPGGEISNSTRRILENKSLRLALEHYYDVLHNRKHQQVKFFTHIFQAQQFLEAKGIPYTMSFAFHQNFRTTVDNEFSNFKPHVTEELNKLIGLINWNRFIEQGNTSYMLWADHNGYDFGPIGHPLEEANFKWGQKTIKHLMDNHDAN